MSEKYSDAQLDAIFTSLLGNMANTGKLIDSLGQGLGQVAQDLYKHIANNGDYTRPQQAQLDNLQVQLDILKTQRDQFVADLTAAAKAFNGGN